MLVLRSEMRFLFEMVGFEVVADYGDFKGGPPAYGRAQVWVLGHVQIRPFETGRWRSARGDPHGTQRVLSAAQSPYTK